MVRAQIRGMLPVRPQAAEVLTSDRCQDHRAPVAQWIERRPPKPKVAGPNPVGRATNICTISSIVTRCYPAERGSRNRRGNPTLPRAMSLIRSQVRTGRLVRVAGVGRAIPTSDKRRGGYLRRSLGAPELWITDYQIHSQWPTLRRSAREARSRGLHQRGVPTRSPPDALGQWRDRPPSAAGHARCPWRFPHETIWCALGCFGEPEG